jgi:hypothetical protein
VAASRWRKRGHLARHLRLTGIVGYRRIEGRLPPPKSIRPVSAHEEGAGAVTEDLRKQGIGGRVSA